MLPNPRKAGKIVLQTFMQIRADVFIKFNCLIPVLAAFMVSIMIILK